MQRANSYTIPAPVGGLNARESLTAMAESDAIDMYNLFPDTTTCKPRNGWSLHNAGDSSDIETLVSYNQTDGTSYLIGVTNNAFYDYTTASSRTLLSSGGITSSRWQSVQFLNQIIFVNGVDQPKKYDGSTFGDATYTGIADDSVLISASNYKSRLYFVEDDSTSIWYGGVNAITGALTEFDVGDVLQLGGRVVYAGSTTQSSGDGVQDYFTIITRQGEVLVYTGDNPGASNWTLSGRYQTAPVTIGNRVAFNFQNDLLFITINGVYSVANLLSSNPINTVTDKIQKFFNGEAQSGETDLIMGWEGLVYEDYNYLLINGNSATGRQYVMNTKTGAWCIFTGINAITFAAHDGKLYFGNTDGEIGVFDNSTDDNGSAIQVYAKQAYNFLGNSVLRKQITLTRPVMNITNSTTLKLGYDTDFNEGITATTTTVTTDNIENVVIPAMGKSFSLIIENDINGSTFDYSATYIIFRNGGIL